MNIHLLNNMGGEMGMKQTCDTCFYRLKANEGQCRGCFQNVFTKWEPKEGVEQMSELIKSKDLFNQLQSKQIAKMDFKETDVFVTLENKQLIYCDANGKRDFSMGHEGMVIINNWFYEAEWLILPNYVSFEEAMKAYAEGKTIISHHNSNGNGLQKFSLCDGHSTLRINKVKIEEGKWSIKD